jgi:MSHA type pilus biogenesis protein MshL
MHTTLPRRSQIARSAAHRSAARRVTTLRWVAGVLVPAAVLAACTTYKPAIPPSEGHISAETVASAQEKERILPPVTSTTTFTPPPRPRTKPTTYSVVVHEVPVKELLLALARDTKENIDIHPGLSGLVSLNAIDETLPAILERIAKQINMRYQVDGRTIIVEPDTPYLKTYKVNYVNMTRDTASAISVSGQVGTAADSGGTSQTAVKTTSKSDFWEVLRKNVDSILAASRKLDQSAAERQARAERSKAQREQRLAQAEAVARAGANATNLFKEVFGEEALAKIEEVDQDIVINPIAGTVTVLATERQHGLVQQYLDSVQSSVKRQVLIEATIAEVQLSQAYQAGIDWRLLANNGNGFRIQQETMGEDVLGAAPRLVIGYGGLLADFNLSIRMLEQFGNTRVLSSPKLMALNNQTALLKVVDNVVYFTITQQSSQAQTSNIITITSTPNTVAVGVVVSLTPQVAEDGNITLTVRPTISRVLRFVRDPNPALTAVPNLVPELAVREMESVLQLTSGQTAILGGLMQDNVQRDRDQVPYAGNLPRVGDLFAYRNENVTKSELVIFIRPIVVRNPSLDSEELKDLRKLLPKIDQTGERP